MTQKTKTLLAEFLLKFSILPRSQQLDIIEKILNGGEE